MENICSQKKKRMVFNIPINRIEMMPTPYSSIITKERVDMRRKVEILKYKSNKQNTKTNNYTKKQLFASAMRGNTPIKSFTNYDEQCLNDKYLHIPTSSSDVPGSVIYLYEEDEVPLYNYVNPVLTRTYDSLASNIINEPWSFIFDETQCFQNTLTTIGSIYIRNVESNYRTFSITTPIQIDITGGTTTQSNVNLSFSFNVFVYYNDNVITSTNGLFGINTQPIVSENTGNISVSSSPFDVNSYFGYLTIDNVKLYAYQNNVYDIKITWSSLNLTSSSNASILFNVSSVISPYTNNCNVSYNSYNPFTIVQTGEQ